MQYGFGTGLLEFTPPGANPTPIQCGVLQEVSLDVDQTIKELNGQYKSPVDIALAELKLSGKAKFALIFGAVMSNILSGASLSSGSTAGGINEVGTVPGAGPYTVTVANSATFVEDLGVIDTNTGLRLTRVASNPATGQYAVAAGVYTFAAADTAHVMWISYSYTTTAGQTVSYSNQLMGAATTFTLTCFNTYRTKNYGLKLYACVFPKLSIALKNNDHTMQNIDFSAYANSAGKVIDQYSSE